MHRGDWGASLDGANHLANCSYVEPLSAASRVMLNVAATMRAPAWGATEIRPIPRHNERHARRDTPLTHMRRGDRPASGARTITSWTRSAETPADPSPITPGSWCFSQRCDPSDPALQPIRDLSVIKWSAGHRDGLILVVELLLFVCEGNLCRSPLAERVLKGMLGQSPPTLEIISAGTSPALGRVIPRRRPESSSCWAASPAATLRRN